MVHDRRRFYGVALYSPSLTAISNIKNLWPSKLMPKANRLIEPNDTCEIEQITYRSKNRYSPSPELDDYIINISGVTYYEYSLYLFGFTLIKKSIILVAAPFSLLLKDIFSHITTKVIGKGISFHQVKISEVISAIEANNNLGGNIKLTLVEMMINGDNNNNLIALQGPNVIHSKSFINLRNSLGDSGLIMAPRKCCLLYNDHEGCRFSLITDHFGNFSFHVGKNGRNLPCSLNLFTYLFDGPLVKETYAFPPVRLFEDQIAKDE